MKIKVMLIAFFMLAGFATSTFASPRIAVKVKVEPIAGSNVTYGVSQDFIRGTAVRALQEKGYEIVGSVKDATKGLELIINAHWGGQMNGIYLGSYALGISGWSSGRSDASDTKRVSFGNGTYSGLFSGEQYFVGTQMNQGIEAAISKYISEIF